MNWVVKPTPPVLLCRCELELLPLQCTVGGIRERTIFSSITYLEENVFSSKYILSLGRKFFLMSICLPFTQSVVCNIFNLPFPQLSTSQNGICTFRYQLDKQRFMLLYCDTAWQSTITLWKPDWTPQRNVLIIRKFHHGVPLLFYKECNLKELLIITT